jgi:hypothetical protein
VVVVVLLVPPVCIERWIEKKKINVEEESSVHRRVKQVVDNSSKRGNRTRGMMRLLV